MPSKEGSLQSNSLTLGLIARIGLEVLFGLRGFLVVPLIARRLGPADYGVYSQIWATVAILVPLISLSLDNGIIRNITRSAAAKSSIPGVVWSGLIAGAMTSVSCALVVPLIWRGLISQLIFGSPEFATETILIGLLVVPGTLVTIGQGFFQARGEYLEISVLQAARAIASVVVMALVAYYGFGVSQIISAAGAVEVVILAFMTGMIYVRIGKVTWKWEEAWSMAVFSWPLAVSNVLYVLLNAIPRFALVHGPGLESVGIYAVSYAVTSLIGQVVSPVHYVIYPECVRLAGLGDNSSPRRVLDVSVKAYLAFAGIVVAVMTVAGSPIIALLANKSFRGDNMLFLALGLGTAFWGVFRLVSIHFLVCDRTRAILYALAGGCLFCQIVCRWLVGSAQATGVAFGFLAGNIVGVAGLLLLMRSGDRLPVALDLTGWLLKVGAAATISGFLAALWSSNGLAGKVTGIAAALVAYALVLALLGYSQVIEIVQTIRALGRNRRTSVVA